MASITAKYKELKTIDKILIPSGLAILVGVAALFSDSLNPLVVAGVVILAYTALHIFIMKPYNTFMIAVMLFQLIAFMPVTVLYGYVMMDTWQDEAFFISTFYVLAGTYTTAWATWKWASGRWATKMLIGFILFGFLAPYVAFLFPTPSLGVALATWAVSVGLVCFPWKRLTTNVEEDIPFGVKNKDVTEAMMELAKKLDGVEVKKHGGSAIDFTVKKGKKTFYVSVLGLNHEIKMTSGTIQYGPHNIKPLVYQSAIEAKKRFFSNNHIPVVINYSDKSKSFVELNASIKAEERRSHQVILTTPPSLVDIINES